MKAWTGFLVMVLGLSLGIAYGVTDEKIEKKSESTVTTTETAPAAEEKSQVEEKDFSEVVGTIQTIDNNSNSFTLYKLDPAPATGESMEFAVTEETQIKQGNSDKTLRDLKVGQEVKVAYEKPLLGFIGKQVALTVEF